MTLNEAVKKAYDELVAEKRIFPTATDYEIHKSLITRRAAWYLYQDDKTFGLLKKTSGNNVLGYSTDIILRTDGCYWDVATCREFDKEKNLYLAGPVYHQSSKLDTNLVSKWAAPTRALAEIIDTPPVVTPTPDPPIPDPTNPNELLKKLEQFLNSWPDGMAAIETRLKALEEHVAALQKKIKPCIFAR
jgi:hypothetical protein